MQKQSRATADKNRKEKKTGKEKKRKERKEKKRKEKKRKEKKRKEKKRKEKKRKEKKAKKRKENKEKKRQNSMLHLKVKVFWQAKAYGQAAHDVHSNSVHLVHESQHSFSAHAMQGYGTCKSEMQTMLSSCIKDWVVDQALTGHWQGIDRKGMLWRDACNAESDMSALTQSIWSASTGMHTVIICLITHEWTCMHWALAYKGCILKARTLLVTGP